MTSMTSEFKVFKNVDIDKLERDVNYWLSGFARKDMQVSIINTNLNSISNTSLNKNQKTDYILTIFYSTSKLPSKGILHG